MMTCHCPYIFAYLLKLPQLWWRRKNFCQVSQELTLNRKKNSWQKNREFHVQSSTNLNVSCCVERISLRDAMFLYFVKWEFHYQLSTRTLPRLIDQVIIHLKFGEVSARRCIIWLHYVGLQLISLGSGNERWRSKGQKSILGSTMNNWRRTKPCHSTAFSIPLAPAMLTSAFPRKLSFNEKGWENPLNSHEKARLRSLNSSRVRDAQSTHPKNRKYSSWRLKCFDIMRRFLSPPSTRVSVSFCVSLSLETSGFSSLAKVLMHFLFVSFPILHHNSYLLTMPFTLVFRWTLELFTRFLHLPLKYHWYWKQKQFCLKINFSPFRISPQSLKKERWK